MARYLPGGKRYRAHPGWGSLVQDRPWELRQIGQVRIEVTDVDRAVAAKGQFVLRIGLDETGYRIRMRGNPHHARQPDTIDSLSA
jgi:hypothetical protein